MQNAQQLTECSGVNKYVNKYIIKMDQQNFVVINVNGQESGALVTKDQFLHYTKITGSKTNEEKKRKSKHGYDHPQGRASSLMEMYHHIFKYSEVLTDLCFKSIPTVALELQSTTEIQQNGIDGRINDGAYIGSISNGIRKSLNLPEFQQHTENELLILDDVAMSKFSVD
eukprot:5497292-Ditylum_brightwellii.AAC.1